MRDVLPNPNFLEYAEDIKESHNMQTYELSMFIAGPSHQNMDETAGTTFIIILHGDFNAVHNLRFLFCKLLLLLAKPAPCKCIQECKTMWTSPQR
jgi:hypothetical protein